MAMNRKQKAPRVVWMARCLPVGLAQTGPFKSQLAAWDAMRGLDGKPVPFTEVWPVRASSRAKAKP